MGQSKLLCPYFDMKRFWPGFEIEVSSPCTPNSKENSAEGRHV